MQIKQSENGENQNLSKNISIILVEPEHPNNVGAVARAMNNMGFFNLRLIKPCDYLSGGKEGAKTLAMHSQDILKNAKVYSCLSDALVDKQVVIAFTNRARGQHKSLEVSWNLEKIFTDIRHDYKIAFVFGREASGLTNAEIDLCNICMKIPTFGNNTSLNLAQAVIVILYEASKVLNKIGNTKSENINLATSNHIENLKLNLFFVLGKIGYIKNGNKSKRWSVFSKLIADKFLTEKEVNIMQGILNKIKEYIR
ncbi:RNA methyltransferase [Fluviispira multicolorata]|uniref:tRNA (cytidine/uridine-2'-O-)-methyltransferase TrmJ n=1 Tax=Fluviispira multicolorata TaxID=2654512 RepID=A0A833N0D0_9BACT|nr:TrmJ/YjtD family RNA methyltransferase [Fluviispira multicolorata]KAB8028472.1 TrmJ/YjtD family RNA methyltransferase [Fluviispira multicolorata]